MWLLESVSTVVISALASLNFRSMALLAATVCSWEPPVPQKKKKLLYLKDKAPVIDY